MDEYWKYSSLLVMFLLLFVAILGLGKYLQDLQEETPVPTMAPTYIFPPPEWPNNTYVLLILMSISDVSDLRDIFSPQYAAGTWIMNEATATNETNPIKISQRYILAVLYYSTNMDDTWTKCSANANHSYCETQSARYLSNSSECEWWGTTCFNTSQITAIQLNSNTLSGTIPFELFQLRLITALDLSNNVLSGTIDESINNMTFLINLDLSYNFLQGPISAFHFHLIPTLVTLKLNNNDFTGTIFKNESTTFSALKTLALSDNKITGVIPTFFTLFSLLEELNLDQNMFTGTIHSSLNLLTRLRTLELAANEFVGTIPSTLGEISSLRYATFHDNFLNGTMPSSICSLDLTTLTSDCLQEGNATLPFYVNCTCCTECCVTSSNMSTCQINEGSTT